MLSKLDKRFGKSKRGSETELIKERKKLGGEENGSSTRIHYDKNEFREISRDNRKERRNFCPVKHLTGQILPSSS